MPISSPSPYRESIRRCEDDRSPRSTSPQPVTKKSAEYTHKRKRKNSHSSEERARKNSDSDESSHHKKKNSSQSSPKHNRKYSTSPPLLEQYGRKKYKNSPNSKKRYKRGESSSSEDEEYKRKGSSSISENEGDHHRTQSPTIKQQRRKKSSDSNSHKERELSISPSTSTHHKKSGKHKRRESNDDVHKAKKKKKIKRKDFEDDREAIVYDDDVYNKNDYNNLEKLEQLKENRYRDKSNDRSNREQFRLSKDYERFNRNQDQRYPRREEFSNDNEKPYFDRGNRRSKYRYQEEKYDERIEEYDDGPQNEKRDREESNERRERERSNERRGSERSNERRDRERSNERRDRERSLERRKKRDNDKKDETNENLDNKEEPPARKKKEEETLGSKTGGAYIPPAKLRMMQARITDKSSVAYQRIAWEALKKSINGLINKVNVSNITEILRELLQENIVRGRGLLARSIIQAQAASPTFTHVYAALVAIINSKFPQNGELILKRLILQFRRAFKRNDKPICLSSTRFIAHLVNQQVVHEVVALEILTLLLENPTDDSVELSTGFLKECGQQLTDVSPRGVHAIFERLRSILHEGQIDKRVQYMIEVMHAVRKDGFVDHPAVITELDLIEENDQFTHLITLEDEMNAEDILNVFKHDLEYEANEDKYIVLKKEILDEDSSNEDDSSGKESGDDSDDDDEDDEQKTTIIDNTETNLIAFRRTVYLAIQSSLDFEECAHKLLKIEFKPGQEVELCHMILDCCSQQRTYEKFYGLLAQRFCQLNKIYVEPFEKIFKDSYDTIHRLETNKLRNVAKCFAHLLYTDAISWTVLAYIRLNEDDTTSSSRIFIKILFQELSEYMGLPKLNERLKDPTLQEAFDGLFPRDNPRNTRFAINFFTSIGLGGLTDELREHLKNIPKALAVQKQEKVSSSSGSSSSSSSSSTASSSSEESSSSSASSSESSSDSESDSESGSASSSKSSSSS